MTDEELEEQKHYQAWIRDMEGLVAPEFVPAEVSEEDVKTKEAYLKKARELDRSIAIAYNSLNYCMGMRNQLKTMGYQKHLATIEEAKRSDITNPTDAEMESLGS